MRSMSTYLLVIVFLMNMVVVVVAQPYQLNWSHTSVQAQSTDEVDAPPAPILGEPYRGAFLNFPPRKYRTRRVQRPAQPEVDPITVTVTAQQSWDHYKNRYRKVSRVESLIYRGGYPEDVVHCNRASYYSYDVFLEDLKPGDRYKVRVTWDDGSHRTVERTIGSLSETSIFIDEPLAFDDSFES